MLLMAAPGAAEHQKRRRGRPLSADLLQNCDLPPPAKLLGPFPTLQRLESVDQKGDGGGGNDSLLRALRLSQSRAREAEQRLAAAGASNGSLAALLVRDSVALSAHRRWVMMLEAENSVLRAAGGGRPAGEDDYGAGSGVATAWWVALAVCVGLALGNLLL
ncbi:unnamed protein product [Alopecurus aequalis]